MSLPSFIYLVAPPVLAFAITPVAARSQPAPAAPGAASLTVPALIAEIAEHHPEAAFLAAEIEAAKAGLRLAGARPNPELSLEAGRKRVREAGGGLAGEGLAWSVSLAQTFEWPGRLALRKSIANREIELAELGLARFKAALAARTLILAAGLHAAQEKSAATREVADRYRSLREVYLARDPAGLTPMLETRVIEAQELALSRRATEAELAAHAALAELNQLRGQPFEIPVRIAPPTLTFPDLPPATDLISAAREWNFEFRIKRMELEQQGLQVSLARHERYPAVTVAPFYSREKAGERESVVGLGLSVPLPLTATSRAPVDAAAARQRQAEAAMQLAVRELEREIVTAAHAYAVKTREIAGWAPDAVGKFREAAALADRHYRLGAVPLATYVELQGAYLDAVEALLDTQREALEARLRLEQLSGTELGAVTKKP